MLPLTSVFGTCFPNSKQRREEEKKKQFDMYIIIACQPNSYLRAVYRLIFPPIAIKTHSVRQERDPAERFL